jgi:hypothetical protein
LSGPHQKTTKKSKTEKIVLATAGEIFSDGSIIELVAARPGTSDDMALLLWDGRKAKIAKEVEYRGQLYQPIELHHSIRHALRLPHCASSYGSTRQLVGELAGLFERYLGFSASESVLASGWNLMTWVADTTPSPPPLLITGPDMDSAVQVFRLLQCLSRRALLLTDVSASTLRSLPMQLHPTLLVNQPDLSPKVLALLRASNYHGVLVPNNGGAVSDVTCPKALYLALEPAADGWSDSALHLPVSPPEHELPPLGPRELAEITERYQSRLLKFRLRHFAVVAQSQSTSSLLNLPACVEEEPNFAKAIGPILERRKQDAVARRAFDINAVVIEVLWHPCHRRTEIPVAEITQLSNALLHARGEILTYSNEEIGWRLKSFGLYRHRMGTGMVLQFSSEHRWRIHQAARLCGLGLPLVDDCPHCGSPDGTSLIES